MQTESAEWPALEDPRSDRLILRDGSVATLTRSVTQTAQGLGEDEQAYLDLMSPFAERSSELLYEILGPLRVPRAPLLLMVQRVTIDAAVPPLKWIESEPEWCAALSPRFWIVTLSMQIVELPLVMMMPACPRT